LFVCLAQTLAKVFPHFHTVATSNHALLTFACAYDIATFFGRTVGSGGEPLSSPHASGGLRFLHNAATLTANLIAAGFIDVHVTSHDAEWATIAPNNKPLGDIQPSSNGTATTKTAMLSFSATYISPFVVTK
jgi:hypothetical protein